MSIFIDNSTTSLLSLALDAAAMRQQAIAQNIANAATPGYQRLSVSFESRFHALQEADGRFAAPSATELASLRPVLQAASDAAPIALDQEMAQLSENTLHHQALLKVLSRHYALLATAINEGKR